MKKQSWAGFWICSFMTSKLDYIILLNASWFRFWCSGEARLKLLSNIFISKIYAKLFDFFKLDSGW